MSSRGSAGLSHEILLKRRRIDQEVRTYSRRSQRVGSAYREKLLEKVFISAGIDRAAITKRQGLSNKASSAFLNSIRRKVDGISPEIEARNRALIDSLQSRYGHGGAGPASPPEDVFILNLADSVSDDFAAGVQHTISTTPWNNTIKSLIGADVDYTSDATFTFNWTAPRNGILNFMVTIPVNGYCWWSSKHGCRRAFLQEELHLTVAMYGIGQSNDFVYETLIVDELFDDSPGCETDVGIKVVDTPILIDSRSTNPQGFAVTAGQSLSFYATLFFGLAADEAEGQMDFITGDRQINVSSIILFLT